MTMDNFRLVAVGGLAEAIEQIAEVQAWDKLIAEAPDYPHKPPDGNRWGTGVHCECHLCRPNRRYR